jgi:cytochrome c biogenesis protein CcmG, thiol:disulfide interchange protein DsbE
MRKIAGFISLALFLTACSSTEPIAVEGKVIGCDAIQTVSSSAPGIECLGGGDPIAIDAIAGPAIINIWGTWCPPCREELPYFTALNGKYGEEIDLIGIAVDEVSQESVRQFVTANGVTWPILYDGENLTKEAFGPGVPVTWFINKSGKVAYKKYGAFSSLDELEVATRKYLGVK